MAGPKDGSRSKKDEFSAAKNAYEALLGLEAAEQARALRFVAEKLGLSQELSPTSASGPRSQPFENHGTGENAQPQGGPPTTARAFMASKKVSNAIEQVACLAYYLTYHKNTQHFKAADLNKLNGDAGAPRIGNIRDAVANATKAHYLARSGAERRRSGYLEKRLSRRYLTGRK